MVIGAPTALGRQLRRDSSLQSGEAGIMRYELSDGEWATIRPMLPNKARGVPRVDDRRVLNGIFWVLRSGAPWRRLSPWAASEWLLLVDFLGYRLDQMTIYSTRYNLL